MDTVKENLKNTRRRGPPIKAPVAPIPPETDAPGEENVPPPSTEPLTKKTHRQANTNTLRSKPRATPTVVPTPNLDEHTAAGSASVGAQMSGDAQEISGEVIGGMTSNEMITQGARRRSTGASPLQSLMSRSPPHTIPFSPTRATAPSPSSTPLAANNEGYLGLFGPPTGMNDDDDSDLELVTSAVETLGLIPAVSEISATATTIHTSAPPPPPPLPPLYNPTLAGMMPVSPEEPRVQDLRHVRFQCVPRPGVFYPQE